jgi:hypothetical protein
MRLVHSEISLRHGEKIKNIFYADDKAFCVVQSG